VFGAQVAKGFVSSGQCKNVLVVGAEILSRILDYKDRNTCVLFGDGAGAAVFTSLDRAGRGEFLGGSISMEGGAEDVLAQPAGGSRIPTTPESIAQGLHRPIPARCRPIDINPVQIGGPDPQTQRHWGRVGETLKPQPYCGGREPQTQVLACRPPVGTRPDLLE
jgi:hypothetical protein